MKVPNGKLRIAGRDFRVSIVEGLADFGSSDLNNQIILLMKEQTDEGKFSAAIHEVIEMVNSIYDLNLPHQTIQTLEAAAFQIIKDNNF